MAKKVVMKRSYPWTGELGGKQVTVRPMTPEDRKAALAFTKALPHSDILFLQSDITQPEVIDDWIASIRRGNALVLLALDGAGKIFGYASLHHQGHSWTRHQGEIRLFVSRGYQGTGVGKHLASEITHVAEDQKLELLVVHVPRAQPHIRIMLERLGFSVEALLTDWLMDIDGKTHDMVVMAKRLND